MSNADTLSHERGRARQLKLTPAIREDVINTAISSGAQGFNFSIADPNARDMLASLRTRDMRSPLGLYPMFPDLQAVVHSLVEGGVARFVTDILRSLGWMDRAKAMVSGARSAITLDPIGLAQTYLDSQVSELRTVSQKTEIRTVLLNEVATDFSISFQSTEVLDEFITHMRDRYGLRAGFVTRNFPAFVRFLESSGYDLKDVTVMTPWNKLGFQMSPTREECEEVLSTHSDSHVIATSVLASGRLSLEEAAEYIRANPGIEAVAIGVSTHAHAVEAFNAFEALFGQRSSP